MIPWVGWGKEEGFLHGFLFASSQWSLDKAVNLNHGCSKCLRQMVVASSLVPCAALPPLQVTALMRLPSTYLLPFCLAAGAVLGMWMGSFRAPLRCTVLSWITSRMCFIQSCLFSILDACAGGRAIRRQCPSRLCSAHAALPCFPTFPVSKELLTEKQTQLSLIDNQADDSNFIYFH